MEIGVLIVELCGMRTLNCVHREKYAEVVLTFRTNVVDQTPNRVDIYLVPRYGEKTSYPVARKKLFIAKPTKYFNAFCSIVAKKHFRTDSLLAVRNSP